MTTYYQETVVRDGVSFDIELHADECADAPWDAEDGHGPVSEWTRRDKRPGERVLNEDRRGFKRYYDFAEAVKIARRDGWDARPYRDNETAGERADKAANADFERLRAWCNDEWTYCGVVVRRSESCKCCGDSASLWGVESDGEYWRVVADELIDEMLQTEGMK